MQLFFVHAWTDFNLDRIDQVHAFPRRTFHDLVTFSCLAAWGLGPVPAAENLSHKETTRRSKHHLFSLFLLFSLIYFFNFIFLVAGIVTMKENREKAASGDEDTTAPTTVQKPTVQTGKRKPKPISSSVDLDYLPSRRGPKKQKSGKASLPKVPKFTQTVDLDDIAVNVVPVQIVPLIQTDSPPPAKAPRKPHSSESSERPPNLVLDKSYAWRTFKGIITKNKGNSCYNMLVKDFERSAIHDLFKVHKFHLSLFCFLRVLNKISNSSSSIHRLCQSFTQSLARRKNFMRKPRRLRRRLKS